MSGKSEAGNKARLWEFMTVEELRLATRRTRTVILPIGVTEQHGYHLPLCTDTYQVYEIAKRVSERTGAVVAPPLPYNFSGGELPGTLNVRPQVVGLMVQDIVAALVANGFKNVIVMPGHGGSESILALQDSLRMALRDHPEWTDVALAWVPIWTVGTSWWAELAKHDYHAGKVETSLMMVLGPHLVRRDRMVTDVPWLARLQRRHPDNYQRVEAPLPLPCVIPRIGQRADIRVGVMGYPEKASAAYGARLVRQIVKGAAGLIRRIERSKSRRYRPVKVKRETPVLFAGGKDSTKGGGA